MTVTSFQCRLISQARPIVWPLEPPRANLCGWSFIYRINHGALGNKRRGWRGEKTEKTSPAAVSDFLWNFSALQLINMICLFTKSLQEERKLFSKSSTSLVLSLCSSLLLQHWPIADWCGETKRNENLRSLFATHKSYKRRNSRYQWNRSILEAEAVACVKWRKVVRER